MKFPVSIVTAALCGAAVAPAALAANLLTNGDFEDFTGPFPDGTTSSNGPITTNPATWNIWRTWPRFQSVDDSSLVDPTLGPTPFPDGWGGENFAQHDQAFTPDTGDDGDYTDQIKQGIDGSRVKPGVSVDISFSYINTEPGRLVTVQVYGIDGNQVWSEFASFPCQFPQFGPPSETCTLLYSANMPYDYSTDQGWKSFAGSFTPAASHDVVAVGITIGGNKGYARGVDDVVLSQNQPPVCTAAAPSVTKLWPPNHALVPISVLGVTDPDGDAVTITVTSVYQDEPVNGTGDGDTAPDAMGVGTATAELRAERAGNGNGRVYRVAFTADDGNGGTCNGTVRVGVPKSVGSKGAPIDDGALYDSTTAP